MLKLETQYKDWLHTFLSNSNHADFWIIATQVLFLIVIAFSTDYISKVILLNTIKKMVVKSKTSWDDILLNRKVFDKLAHIVPALILQSLITLFFREYTDLVYFLSKGINAYILFISIRVIISLINGMHDIYLTMPVAKDRPIKSYLQIIIILIYFTGALLLLSIVIDKDITSLFAGLGAVAAVLMLVFKDSILGLVGGIQLSGNDMIKIGDWVEMPSRKADGEVIDISLHTVKIQNWDKTITTIPTYAMVNESFINWRGMEQSGGRRIKRSINIDMTSVKFCTENMINRYKKIKILKPYIEDKLIELENHNLKNNLDEEVKVNGRRMTNLGTFRKYIEAYIRNHPKINKEMTLLIRHLQPGETGIPIEIYVFSNDKVWANFEAIQADIFDHILAVIPEFELSVFQNPTGSDFKALLKN